MLITLKLSEKTNTRSKLWQEALFTKLFQGSLLLTVLFLGVITVYVFWNGSLLFTEVSPLNFFLGLNWEPVNNQQFGILPMIITSLYITLASLLVSAPLGIGCAIFAAELANNQLKDLIQGAIAILAGIPSVVYGLIGLSVLVPFVQKLGNSAGYSILAAIIILSIMILPTIVSIAQDALESVPKELKQASLALGATHFQTIIKVVLSIAKPGITAALVLAVSRALGEAMAVKMVLGNIQTAPDFSPGSWFGLLSPARALTTNIIGDIEYAREGSHLQALFATGAVLFILTMLVNYLAYLAIRWSNQYKNRRPKIVSTTPSPSASKP